MRTQRLLHNDREQSSVRDLESNISQQEEIIAQTQSSLAAVQAQLNSVRDENKRLQTHGDESQKYQDEIDVLKLDLEKQTRKANTADKYMAKLQNSQTIEKERDALRRDLDNARERLLSFEKLRLENMALQKSNDEASRTLSQIEREHEELRMTKKQLRTHYDSMVQQVATLTERYEQDQELIQELQDRKASPLTPRGGLDGELESSWVEPTHHGIADGPEERKPLTGHD